LLEHFANSRMLIDQ